MKLVLSFLLITFSAIAAEAAGCQEGDRALFLESSADGMTTEWNHVVCRNGVFKETPKVVPRPCTEGHTEMVIEHKGQLSIPTWRTCKNGSYYPPVKAPRILKCKEGKVEIFFEGVTHTKYVHSICRGGMFKKLY